MGLIPAFEGCAASNRRDRQAIRPVRCQAVSMDLQIAEPAINSAGSNGCN
jgi:hypothetical protein